MFGVDGGRENAIHHRRVFARIALVQPLEAIGDVLDQPHVPIVTAELHVAVGGDGLDVARRQPQQRGVERAAAEVVDQDRHLLLGRVVGREIAEHFAEGQGGGRRLVDDVQHLQARHLAGVAGAFAARLVEIGRHGNHDAIDFAERANDFGLQLLQDARLNHFRRQLPAVDGPPVIGQAHVALDPFGHQIGLDHRGRARLLADDHLLVAEQHDARRQQIALDVADHRRMARFIDPGHRRKGGSQVDSNGAFVWHGEKLGAKECDGETASAMGLSPCQRTMGLSSSQRCSLLFQSNPNGGKSQVAAARGAAESRCSVAALGGCEKMGTGSEPVCANPVKTASREVPVPIFLQPLRETASGLRDASAGARSDYAVYYQCMATAQPITTAEQLFQAPDLGRCELLRGELIMMSPAGSKHGMIALRIGRLLSDFVEPRGLGIILGAETGFRVASNPDTVLAPDAAFIRSRADRRRICPTAIFPGPPDLAVEVLSPNDRAGEVLAKVQDWLSAGCAGVWVVDPKSQTVTVYGADRKAAILTAGESLTGGELLPGFSTPVAGIFTM